MEAPEEVFARLVRWASEQGAIRVVILTSSRTDPDQADLLSDYDIILVVTDAAAFGQEDSWQLGFGTPMVRWGDDGDLYGVTTHFRGVVYENGVKVDYSIWPLELLERVSQHERLPDSLDAGYRVLLDKDGVTGALRSATYKAYIPAKPTEKEYRALVEEFWWGMTYAAKSLWRNDVLFAKSYIFEHEIRLEVLTRLLGWQIEIDHDWSLPMRRFGRGVEQLLRPETWSQLASTYVGTSIEDNWNALFRIATVFRTVARDVGDALGFAYPHELDDLMTAYLHNVRNLPQST